MCYKKLKIILLADHDDAALISLKMIIWWVGWGYVKKEKQIQQILYIGGSPPPAPPAWGQLVTGKTFSGYSSWYSRGRGWTKSEFIHWGDFVFF